MSVVATTMPQAEVTQCSRVMGMMTAGPNKISMAVMMAMNAVMAAMSDMMTVMVMIKVVMQPVPDCVVANVVNDVIDGEHRRAKRHQSERS